MLTGFKAGARLHVVRRRHWLGVRGAALREFLGLDVPTLNRSLGGLTLSEATFGVPARLISSFRGEARGQRKYNGSRGSNQDAHTSLLESVRKSLRRPARVELYKIFGRRRGAKALPSAPYLRSNLDPLLLTGGAPAFS
jgi:hypothetical protein